MTKEQLDRGIVIQAEIEDISRFIHNAEMLWTARLQIRKPKMFFKMNAYGAFTGSEIKLDNVLKNEVLELVKNRRDRLVQELNDLN